MKPEPEVRTTICRVERGLYTLRFVEAANPAGAVARVTVLSGNISFIPGPGREGDLLKAPGEVLVIRAEAPSEFELRVIGSMGGSTDAKFSIDMLDPGETQVEHRGIPAVPVRPVDDRERFSAERRRERNGELNLAIVAHVSRRGDVVVGDDEWVAGPDVVLPIEGVAISTGHSDVGVLIRVQSSRGGSRWSRWHDPEEFAGSRQQADSLTAIALALTGVSADRYEIVADVMSLGAPPRSKRGQIIEFLGVDPIVGFRFALQPAIGSEVGASTPIASPLRIFRAKR